MMPRPILILLLTVILAGCTSPRKTNPYAITHPTWWNFYQRGRVYLHDGKFPQAAADFETALGRRPGARYPYTQERWRARTYGMHTIEGYFPHRELGIARFNQGHPTEALELLNTSMQQEPSARAKYYINRIYEALALSSAPSPEIVLPQLPEWTMESTFSLNGVAVGSNHISSLTIGKTSEFIELVAPRYAFSKELSLKEGPNRIRIAATDTSGKQTITQLTLTADWTAPEILMERKGPNLVLHCRDLLGLRQLQLNGTPIVPTGNEHTLIYPAQSAVPLELTATDRAGNRTALYLSAKELRVIAQAGAPAPPVLEMIHAGQTLTQFVPEYELDIRAQDDTALKAIELNGKNLLSRPSPLFRGRQRLWLEPGTNCFTLTAVDFDENRTEQQLRVIYREPEYVDRIYRLSVVTSPLGGKIPDPGFAQRVNHLMQQELTLPPERFHLLAGETDLQLTQREQELSSGQLVDPRAMLRQGRKREADLILISRVLSDSPGQTIYTQVLDAETGKELFVEDIYMEHPEQLPHQLAGLVMKVEQRFPLIKAHLQSLENQLGITAGAANGAQEGMRFMVIRSKGSFEEGRIIRNGTRPVEVVVSEVENRNATVILPRKYSNTLIQSGDFVFAR